MTDPANEQPDEYTSSGHHADYARSLRAEQNRDAAPHPDEVREEIRRELRERGCERDGCDVSDPDDLELVPDGYEPSCPAQQHPAPKFASLCSEHQRTEAERHEAHIRERLGYAEDALAVYECGATRSATREETPEDAPPQFENPPKLPSECRCGAHIESVRYPDE